MLLFLLTAVVVALGVGVFEHYNQGTMDVTVRTYHLMGIPTWEALAAAAGASLVPFLLHSIYTSVRIRGLRRASRIAIGRTFNDLPAVVPVPATAEPAPKRSWTTSRD